MQWLDGEQTHSVLKVTCNRRHSLTTDHSKRIILIVDNVITGDNQEDTHFLIEWVNRRNMLWELGDLTDTDQLMNKYINKLMNISKWIQAIWISMNWFLFPSGIYSIQARTYFIFCTPSDFGPKVLKNVPKAKHFANDIEYCYYSYYWLICCRPIDGNTIGIQWTETINKNTQMYDVFDP